MSRIWYSSDLHYQHAKVAALRGFTTVEEHDAVVLENWNKAVRAADVAFILGDFALDWKGVEGKIKAMNGRLVLIAGNHDPMFGGFRDGWKHQARYVGLFEAVQAFARRKAGRREFLMSHFPYLGGGDHTETERYREYRLPDEGRWLLHGHTHSPGKLSGHPRQLHVGVDAWGLSPAGEDEVLHVMAGTELGVNG